MKYDELLKSRRIYREKMPRKQIRQALDRAERDLRTAQALMVQDWDWSFARGLRCRVAGFQGIYVCPGVPAGRVLR